MPSRADRTAAKAARDTLRISWSGMGEPRRSGSGADRFDEGRDFGPVAFVLSQGLERPRSTRPPGFCPPEIFHAEGPSVREDLQRFLGVALGAVGEVVQSPERSVGEIKQDGYLVLPHFRAFAHHHRRHSCHLRPGQIRKQIDEVAAFADDPSAPDFRVLRPVIRRNRSRIDGHAHRQRFAPACQPFFHLDRVGEKRRLNPTMTARSGRFFAASSTRFNCRSSTANGFSTKTCFPASRASQTNCA